MKARNVITVLICIITMIAVSSANYVDMVNALGPVSYWRLDETSGNVASDEKGVQDGTYNNVTLGQEGALSLKCNDNKAACFINAYVEIDHSDAYELDEGTVQFWFKDLNTITDSAIFSKDSKNFDDGGHLTFMTNAATQQLSVRLQSDADNYYVVNSTPIVLDTWYLVTLTFGSGGMELYINDGIVDTNDYTGGIENNTEPIALGANTWLSDDGKVTPLTGFFSGCMDEVVIYDSVLSEQEIADLYDFATTCVPEPCTLVMLGLGGFGLLRRRRME